MAVVPETAQKKRRLFRLGLQRMRPALRSPDLRPNDPEPEKTERPSAPAGRFRRENERSAPRIQPNIKRKFRADRPHGTFSIHPTDRRRPHFLPRTVYPKLGISNPGGYFGRGTGILFKIRDPKNRRIGGFPEYPTRMRTVGKGKTGHDRTVPTRHAVRNGAADHLAGKPYDGRRTIPNKTGAVSNPASPMPGPTGRDTMCLCLYSRFL